jgi:carboxylate-amine ligase
MAATYQFGIEEELFLADAETRATPKHVEPFHRAVRDRMPTVERELLVSQMEIMTQPCTDFAAARSSLARSLSTLQTFTVMSRGPTD